jgi:hypothetical protein
MPYFHVQITQNTSNEFIVDAADKDAAENIALAAWASEKCDNKKVVKLHANSNSAVSISDCDKAAWLDTLKKAKAK